MRRFRWLVPVVAVALPLAVLAGADSTPAGFSDWPKYNFDLANTGMSTDTTITTGNASGLKLSWSDTSGSVGAHAQPTVIGNTVYWNTWDGTVHANNVSTGASMWTHNLGENHGACAPTAAALSGGDAYGSVNGTPAIFTADIADPTSPVVTMYALNAATGATLWSTVLETDGHSFTYSSPVFYNGSVYYSTASLGDCPLIAGAVYRVDASTGHVAATFAAGAGVGIWGSPAIDTARNEVYYATGAPGGTYAYSVIGLDASSLALVDHYHFPLGGDSDFGSSPTLFSAGGTDYLGVGNKDGHYYVLNRASISAGPLHDYGLGGAAGQPRTTGEIGPSAWDGRYLYVPIGTGGTCGTGGVHKIDTTTWTDIAHLCTPAPVITSVAIDAGGIGVVTTASSGHIVVFNTSTMGALLDYPASHLFWAAPSIGSGHIFATDMGGRMYALGLTGTGTPPPTPTPCAGASSPPTNLVGSSPSAGTFSLTWSAPTTCPGSPTFYDVALYSAATNSFSTAEVSTTSFSASGLTPNTYYIATVTAYNGIAWSAWSSYSNWVLVTGSASVQHTITTGFDATAGHYTFTSPDSGPVHVGDTLVWHDVSGADHTVVWDSSNPTDSGATPPFIPADGTSSAVTVTSGSGSTFSYHCGIHGTSQSGTLTVS